MAGITDVAIDGGGVAGLSAAGLTAKNGLDTVVFEATDPDVGLDHHDRYPFAPDVSDNELFEELRARAEEYGVDRHRTDAMTAVEQLGDGFRVTPDNSGYEARYVLIASENAHELASALGCAIDEDGRISVDLNMHTSISDAYVVDSRSGPEDV